MGFFMFTYLFLSLTCKGKMKVFGINKTTQN